MNARITDACPALLSGNVNHLAATLGGRLLDLVTFRAPTWSDSQGKLLALASLLMTSDREVVPHSSMARPS